MHNVELKQTTPGTKDKVAFGTRGHIFRQNDLNVFFLLLYLFFVLCIQFFFPYDPIRLFRDNYSLYSDLISFFNSNITLHSSTLATGLLLCTEVVLVSYSLVHKSSCLTPMFVFAPSP